MNYYVHFSRKKPYLSRVNKKERLSFARPRRKWDKKAWRGCIYTDEIKVEIGSGGARRKVRRRPGTGLEDRYLEPNLPGDETRQMFWAAFTYGHHTPLVPIRQRTEKERVDGRDRLGFNSAQYVKEIVVPYLLPLYEECGGADAGIQTIEDGSRVHTSRYCNKFRRMNGISRMPWPANSGDLNPIENVWALFKRRFREACRDPRRRPRN